jgi:pimeloyl-ACP methyl ester carboxylesterase
MRLSVNGDSVFAYTGTKPVVAGHPTIMFVHGAANDHSVWALQSRYFAYHGWNVLAVDLPGHGKSQGSPLPTIEQMADWSASVLDAARVERATLVGHSMGSLIALETAARHPARVEALALIGTAFPMKVSEALLGAAQARSPDAVQMINVWSHSNGGQRGSNRVPGLWTMGMSQRLLERMLAPLHTDFDACNRYNAGLESAAAIRCPVLAISGARDLMTPPRAAKALVGKFASVTSVTLEGSGHDLMQEQPDAVLDALIEFVSAR